MVLVTTRFLCGDSAQTREGQHYGRCSVSSSLGGSGNQTFFWGEMFDFWEGGCYEYEGDEYGIMLGVCFSPLCVCVTCGCACAWRCAYGSVRGMIG